MDENELNRHIMGLLRRIVALSHAKIASGRTSQANVLRILHKHGPISQKDLQEELGIRQASLSELVQKMEKSGLIERKKDEKDHRKVVLNFTELGVKTEEKNRELHRAQRNEILSCLSLEEKEDLERILDKLYTFLNDEGKTL